MINADWKYYILDENGKSGRIVNGTVQYLGTPQWLTYAPDGNQDITIAWERNMSRYGNLRNFSLPLGFVIDGATILRDGLYKSNVDKKLYLLIQRRVLELDALYFRDYYKFFYKGQFEFTSAEDKQGEERFEVNLMEGGMWKLLKAKEDAVYSIELDEDAVTLKMDGIDLYSKYNWLLTDQGFPFIAFYAGVEFINSDGQAPGFAALSSLRNFDVPSATNTQYFGEAVQDVGGNFTGILNVSNALGIPDQTVDLEVYNVLTNTTTVHNMFSGPVGPEEVITIPVNFPLDLVKGDRLFIKSHGTTSIIKESTLSYDTRSKYGTTWVRAFMPYILFRKLVEKITGSADNAVSDFLQGSTFAITSGDGLRGLAGAKIKTSLKDFFTAFNVYHLLGMGVEDEKIVIEPRAHFFQYGNPIECGSTKAFIATPTTDLFFSRLKIGHAEQNIDSVNGKYDFNGWSNYTSPIDSVSNELDLTSPYKAGPYEIETVRVNFEGKTTTDSDNDNSVYTIHVAAATLVYEDDSIGFLGDAGGGIVANISLDIPLAIGSQFTTSSIANPGPFTVKEIFRLLNENIVTVNEAVTTESLAPLTITITRGFPYTLSRIINVTAGVPSPETIFNVALAPAYLVRVHGPWLAGILQEYSAGVLKFGSNNRNENLISQGPLDAEVIHNADIPVSALGSAMFAPHYFEYGTQVPIALIEELDLDPNRSFSGDWEGIAFEGFCIKTGLAPNTKQEQKFKLLAVPTTDIKNFIT